MALNQTQLVPVTNISGAPVVYTIPEMNIRREFSKNETKGNISVKEIRSLWYMPGGDVLIKDYLSVGNDELLAELGVKPEAEYHWTEEDVKNLLLHESLERLQDALDFAPAGIVEIIKDLAVSLEINDMSKRQAILDKTGMNITKAIDLLQAEKAALAAEPNAPETHEVTLSSGRRVAVTDTKTA